jgi:hypothetical protein
MDRPGNGRSSSPLAAEMTQHTRSPEAGGIRAGRLTDKEIEAECRHLARETYKKTRIGRSYMPDPDSDEGQRKIDRLYDIIVSHVRSRSQ